ncbi:MAG: transcription termination/antitermination NusG family protein [Anaerohalosphaeraceae bacterium]
MLKKSDNPPIVWPEGQSIGSFDGVWWVAHTKSRNEKALAWQLIQKEISYFLPMSWKVSRRTGRTMRSLMPVFPGYLFFCGTDQDRLEVLKTNRAAAVLTVRNQMQLIQELLPIEKVLKAGQTVVPHEYLQVGQRCRVIAGPLMGVEGLIVQTPRKAKLVLQVQMLGQAASVEIDMDMVEQIE